MAVWCGSCIGQIAIASSAPPVRYAVELAEGHRIEFTCNEGHSNIMYAQSPLHELVFDSAILALADGYPREAIVSFAAAWERSLSYAIGAMLAASDVDEHLVRDLVRRELKRSERETGAFAALFTARFRRLPKMLTNDDVNDRNDAVHNGALATYGEALSFGNTVLACMYDTLNTLQTKLGDQFTAYETKEMIARSTKAGRGDPVGTLSHITAIASAVRFGKDLSTLIESEARALKSIYGYQATRGQ